VRQINHTVRSVADLHVTEHEVRTLLEGPLAEYVVRFDYQVGHRRFAAYRLRNNIRRASLFGLWPNRPFFRIKVAGATSPD
jgi:hypothetical protein